MKKKQKNNICKCGHIKEKHIFAPEFDSLICFIRRRYKGSYIGSIHCTDFKLDNLKYLEKLYEEKSNKN
jgi:hypothetical protein